MINIDILKLAYNNLAIDLQKEHDENSDVGVSIPSFEWFCELISSDSHILYEHYVKPIYEKELRKKKINNLKDD